MKCTCNRQSFNKKRAAFSTDEEDVSNVERKDARQETVSESLEEFCCEQQTGRIPLPDKGHEGSWHIMDVCNYLVKLLFWCHQKILFLRYLIECFFLEHLYDLLFLDSAQTSLFFLMFLPKMSSVVRLWSKQTLTFKIQVITLLTNPYDGVLSP